MKKLLLIAVLFAACNSDTRPISATKSHSDSAYESALKNIEKIKWFTTYHEKYSNCLFKAQNFIIDGNKDSALFYAGQMKVYLEIENINQ